MARVPFIQVFLHLCMRAVETSHANMEPGIQDDGSFVCAQGALSKKEVDQAMLQFRAFDIDGDGVVSFADFATAMTKHNAAFKNPSRQPELRKMFKDADIDNNGQVDRIDFFLMRVRDRRKQRAAAAAVVPAGGGAQAVRSGPSQQHCSAAPSGSQSQGVEDIEEGMISLDVAAILQVAQADRGPGSGTPRSQGSGSSDQATERSYHSAISSQASADSSSTKTSAASGDIEAQGGAPAAAPMRKTNSFLSLGRLRG